MTLRGAAACDLTGIPALHAEAFQEVANAEHCVIASRAVGIYATGLILEGYSSKGFHNKAKSCNFGPMAGFVLDDPRFTKVGGTAKGRAEQTDALLHAIDAKAVEVPLFISDARRRWLESNNLYKVLLRSTDEFLVRSALPGSKASLEFRLVRARPGGSTEPMWAVLYPKRDRQSARGAAGKADGEWTPVMAMRDPLCTISASDYRAATTGDYDLFSIWPKKGMYSPGLTDKRMVGHAQLESNIKAKAANTGEDEHLGNMTPRIRRIRDGLNTAIARRGYTGGNMVHHSDEGGRPFVGDIDLPVFAVVPDEAHPYALTDVPDLRAFVSTIAALGYAPIFSPGWMKQLVFGAMRKDEKDGKMKFMGDQLKAELLAKTKAMGRG